MADPKKVAKDTYLFRDGDAPDAMYIVKSGQLAITKTKGSSEITLAEIGPGAMVGEMAIFDLKPRSASVKATKDSEVIALPYDALLKQLDQMPVWLKSIMKTMNENLRDANKKIKLLESSTPDQDRFPPHVINKLLSILNFVGMKYGTKEDLGILLPQNRLRNYTIQVFQEATNKMDSMMVALKGLGLFVVDDLGEGKKKIVNLNPEFLFDFVDWHNDWIYKQDKDKISVSPEEVKVLLGIIHFAKKSEADPKKNNAKKVNLNNVQNESMKELGFLIKLEELNSLIEKKLISEKIMENNAVFVHVILEDIEKPTNFWKFLWDLKKCLH